MKTINLIFQEVKLLNPNVSEISSLGKYVSNSSQMVVDSITKEVKEAITNKDSLAFKIIQDQPFNKPFTDKQLWVISFELYKNQEYVDTLVNDYERRIKEERAKIDASKSKLQSNKEASADILEPVKKLRKLGEFGKWLNTSGNQYRKQHFSKKYTTEAVNSYLATIS